MKLFQRLTNSADAYLANSDWKDMVLLKLCLCSAGIMLGAAAVKLQKKSFVPIVAAFVFTLTYIPIMLKFLPFLQETPAKE